jgi:hypothetical protein
VTHLGRSIDPRYSSNRAILVIGPVAGAAGYVRWSDNDLWRSLLDAALIGILVGVAWAFAREIDPDRPTSATIAALFTLGVAMIVESIAVLPMAGLMVAGRILIRSTGKPPTTIDLLALTGGAFILGRTAAGWVAALVLAFAIARDRTLPGLSTSRLARVAVPFAIPVVATVAVFLASDERWSMPPWWMLGVAIAGVISAMFMPAYLPMSRCDLRGEPLEPRRLQSARRVTAVGALLISALGTIGLVPMLPVWLSFVAVWLTHTAPIPELHPVEAGNPADSR